MRKCLAWAAGVTLAMPAVAQDLVIPPNATITLPSGQDFIAYQRLVIGANGSLVIPEGMSRLTLRAEHFVAEPGARIYQYSSKRAANGQPGSTGAQGARGEEGKPGGTGLTGTRGRDSVALTLQLGIAKLDETTITLASQSGGHGGVGGAGGEGGESGCSNPRRDGGQGGVGGKGGMGAQPGAVGALRVVWWPVAEPVAYFSSGQPIALSIVLEAGQVGFPNAGGRGGNGAPGKDCALINGTSNGPGGPAGPPGEYTAYQEVRNPVEFERREVAP